MKTADFQAARAYAFNRLAKELPPWMYYHSLAHTSETVVPAAERLAKMEGLSPDQQGLTTTGATFHDLGMVIQYSGHETAGAQIAREVLPGFGFSPQDIQTVVGIILATRLPQSPHTILESIVADADLSVLGLDHFLERNSALRREQAVYGRTFTDSEWFESQIRFVKNHKYFTPSAHVWLDRQQELNLLALTELYAASAVIHQD